MGEVSELWQQAALGAGGGVGAEMLHWYLLARKDPAAVKAFAAGWVYWLTTVGMVLFGALMPVLYLEGSGSPILCFHLGAATPILLQKMVSAAPEVTRDQGGSRGSPEWTRSSGARFRDFLAW